jgi:hypothetical protein
VRQTKRQESTKKSLTIFRIPATNQKFDKACKAIKALFDRWVGVLHMREYKRRYEQIVSFKDKSTVPLLDKEKHHRVYYMKPRWLCPGGCDCPCVPMCFTSFYQLHAHHDEKWSSDDKEGTVWAYDYEGNVEWVEYMKTGEKVEANETVVPYVGVVDNVFQDPHMQPIAPGESTLKTTNALLGSSHR